MRPRTQRRAAKTEPSAPTPRSSRTLFLAISLALLVPCLWHSRIQAGDLSSHIYNAWLAQLVRQGHAPGLSIVFQSTNVLFDMTLGALFGFLGPDLAQRLAVILAVLVFVWGAFAFVTEAAGRPAWHMLPILAVLAYGWVFHMGLFNFYLGLGLSFWAMAMAWQPTGWRLLAAALLLALAYVAQNMAPAWAVALLAYRWIAARLSPRHLRYLLVGAVAAIVVLRVALAVSMRTNWSISQILLITGADQAMVFDTKYEIVSIGLLLVWGTMLWSSRRSVSGILFQFCLLTAAGIFILPTWIWLPRYDHALVFVAERMSLAAAVCLCAALAATPVAAWQRYAAAAVAAIFFLFLYGDEGKLNAMEDSIAEAVSQLPPGQRVLCTVHTPQLRTNPVDHMIDRVCLGRCYSYANYEPSSAAFRIRVTGPSSLVAPTDMDSSRMQNGGYAVKPRDLPLYRIALSDTGQLVVQGMPPGALVGASDWNGF